MVVVVVMVVVSVKVVVTDVAVDVDTVVVETVDMVVDVDVVGTHVVVAVPLDAVNNSSAPSAVALTIKVPSLMSWATLAMVPRAIPALGSKHTSTLMEPWYRLSELMALGGAESAVRRVSLIPSRSAASSSTVRLTRSTV